MKVELNQERLEQAIIDQTVNEILGDEQDIYDRIRGEIDRQVTAALAKNLNSGIEKMLNEIMEKALDTEAQPVNIWGEREGKPTTIRAALHDRAQAFWQEIVDSKGEKASYGGRPRYEHVLSIITAREFDTAVKQNIINVAGAIKDAVRADFYKAVDTQLNAFFKVTTLDDKRSKS